MIDLQSLNPPQREAVEHINGPTLVLAGAGSGKTRVLTYKIAHLVQNGIKPWRILAVTFTNKAAREMSSRAEKLLNTPVEHLWIGTFHGICVRILRREAVNWGYKRAFTIYDRDDQKSVIKKALKALGIPKETLPPSRAIYIIGKAKNNFIPPEKLSDFAGGHDVELLSRIYQRYTEMMRSAGAFDFDDLLLCPVEMFRKYPESLEFWKRKFDHILVDEYQDTNKTQYLLLKLLTESHGKITVVGDDDQSIYSWRGADIQNILGFEHDYNNVRTFRLEQNYRSTGNILKAANSIVKHNERRMVKKLWTDAPDGDKVKVLECMNDRDEAERVVSSITEEYSRFNCKLGDFVILYRTNAQSRSFEDVLRRRVIRYVIVGGLRFYERSEVKDILAYLRLLNNPDDIVSFTRAITTPKRGIGEKTIEVIGNFAAGNNLSLADALNRADEALSGAMLKKAQDFAGILQSASEKRGMSGLGTIAQDIVEKSGYEKYLEKEFPENYEDRIDNINELITAMDEFENLTEEDDLSAFLAEVALVADVDMWDDTEDVVKLMTLHSAKGLEFPSVYIVGVERGLFPLPQSFDDKAQIEEERRLFYVGITRAEQRIHVSYALSRARHGSYSGGASMFVSDLPFELLDIETPEPMYAGKPVRNQPVRRPMEFEDYSQEIPDHDEDLRFRIGSWVRHPVYGKGRIIEYSGYDEKTSVTIMFGAQKKKINVKFGKLVPV